MDLNNAKQQVIDISLRLLQSGLVARTWGNMSARVDGGHFVITPSGKAYESITLDDIVITNVKDGRSWGDVRPSSEKRVHCSVYALREDAGFVVHTHQPEASVLSAMHMDIPVVGSNYIFGECVPCAAYGFPGSETLRDHVAAAVAATEGNAVLMANHGAVCYGESAEEAMHVAVSLEMLSTYTMRQAFEAFIGRPMRMDDDVYSIVMAKLGIIMPKKARLLFRSERNGESMDFYSEDGTSCETVSLKASTLSNEQVIHRDIYAARPDIGAIYQSLNPFTVAASAYGMPLPTYLDDFAQINGPVMACTDLRKDDIIEALGENHGVLLRDHGALCCGNNLYDAEALAIVTEKNAKAWFFGQIFPDNPLCPVSPEECEQMRRFYLDTYSKCF